MGCCRASKVEFCPAAGVGLCGRAAIHTFNEYRGVQALDVSAHFFAVIAWFSGPRTAIAVTETRKAVVQNNTASIDGSIIEKAKNSAKKLMGKSMDPIHVRTTVQSIVKNNKIVEQ